MKMFVLSFEVIIQLVLIAYLTAGHEKNRFRRQIPNVNNQNMMMSQMQVNHQISQNPQMGNVNNPNVPSSPYQQNIPMPNSNNPNLGMPQMQLQQNQARPNGNNMNMMTDQFQQNPSIPNQNNPRMSMNAPESQPMNSNDQFMQYNNPPMQMNPQQSINKNPQINQNSQQVNTNPMMNNGRGSMGVGIPGQTQMDQSSNQGFYQNQYFQQSPFPQAKPNGWFGTNRENWMSVQDTELDKNKMAGNRQGPMNNFPPNSVPVQRTDGGPLFLANIAKKFASEGPNSFKISSLEATRGRGSVCTNFENFNGFIYGKFPCPLPPSTGMNQMDVFCCGPTNYQYCCNSQEFQQSQRGGFTDSRNFNDPGYPQPTTYSTSTKKILAIVLPIVSFLVLSGVGVLVFLYYKKFRQAQYRVGKPSGATRFDENYTALAQDQFND